MLEGKTVVSPQDQLALSNEWNSASARLDALKSSDAAVSALSDPSVQKVLRAVVNETKGPTKSIDDELKSGTVGLPLLRTNLSETDNVLRAANSLAGEVLINISSGLKTAQAIGAGKQGLLELTPEMKIASGRFSSDIEKKLNLQ